MYVHVRTWIQMATEGLYCTSVFNVLHLGNGWSESFFLSASLHVYWLMDDRRLLFCGWVGKTSSSSTVASDNKAAYQIDLEISSCSLFNVDHKRSMPKREMKERQREKEHCVCSDERCGFVLPLWPRVIWWYRQQSRGQSCLWGLVLRLQSKILWDIKGETQSFLTSLTFDRQICLITSQLENVGASRKGKAKQRKGVTK